MTSSEISTNILKRICKSTSDPITCVACLDLYLTRLPINVCFLITGFGYKYFTACHGAKRIPFFIITLFGFIPMIYQIMNLVDITFSIPALVVDHLSQINARWNNADQAKRDRLFKLIGVAVCMFPIQLSLLFQNWANHLNGNNIVLPPRIRAFFIQNVKLIYNFSISFFLIWFITLLLTIAELGIFGEQAYPWIIVAITASLVSFCANSFWTLKLMFI